MSFAMAALAVLVAFAMAALAVLVTFAMTALAIAMVLAVMMLFRRQELTMKPFRQFFLGRIPDFHDVSFEIQGLTGHRMIEVHLH